MSRHSGITIANSEWLLTTEQQRQYESSLTQLRRSFITSLFTSQYKLSLLRQPLIPIIILPTLR